MRLHLVTANKPTPKYNLIFGRRDVQDVFSKIRVGDRIYMYDMFGNAITPSEKLAVGILDDVEMIDDSIYVDFHFIPEDDDHAYVSRVNTWPEEKLVLGVRGTGKVEKGERLVGMRKDMEKVVNFVFGYITISRI